MVYSFKQILPKNQTHFLRNFSRFFRIPEKFNVAILAAWLGINIITIPEFLQNSEESVPGDQKNMCRLSSTPKSKGKRASGAARTQRRKRRPRTCGYPSSSRRTSRRILLNLSRKDKPLKNKKQFETKCNRNAMNGAENTNEHTLDNPSLTESVWKNRILEDVMWQETNGTGSLEQLGTFGEHGFQNLWC